MNLRKAIRSCFMESAQSTWDREGGVIGRWHRRADSGHPRRITQLQADRDEIRHAPAKMKSTTEKS